MLIYWRVIVFGSFWYVFVAGLGLLFGLCNRCLLGALYLHQEPGAADASRSNCLVPRRLMYSGRVSTSSGWSLAKPVQWLWPETKIHLGVSENSVPLNPMVNDHYPY